MEVLMSRMAYAFFVLAFMAIPLAVTGFAGVSMEIARLFLFGFLIIGGASLLYGLISGRTPPRIP
jgi:hypothetical protein